MSRVSTFGRFMLSTALGFVFEYDTPKYVHIKNKKIGLLFRLVQLGIIGYIIGYGIVYKRGYQQCTPVVSTVTAKVKGADLLSGDSEPWLDNCNDISGEDFLVMDHADLVIPPHEPNSFFITTNMWVTCNQKVGICPEAPSVPKSNCSQDSDCPVNTYLRNGNGPTTGLCSVNGTGEEGTCMVRAWCPVEEENETITLEGPKIRTSNFTVLVKNSVSFPLLVKGYHSRNIPASASKEFLKNCTFNTSSAEGRTCPIFSLGQIVGMVNDSEGYYEELATEGAVIGLRVVWDCNLNYDSKYCQPTYEAMRLDNPSSNISKGFNFRYPRYHYEASVQNRDLIKAYGILFIIQVTGQGCMFDFTTLVLKIGSMIALLAIATTVCDVLVLYLLKKAVYYRKKKYQNVDDSNLENSAQDPDFGYGTLEDSDSNPTALFKQRK